MEFEYDTAKSKVNKDKHGIDFEDAQALWNDDYVEIALVTERELRNVITGKIKGVFYTAVFTPRNQNIRIISVRRARKKEIELYDLRKT